MFPEIFESQADFSKFVEFFKSEETQKLIPLVPMSLKNQLEALAKNKKEKEKKKSPLQEGNFFNKQFLHGPINFFFFFYNEASNQNDQVYQSYKNKDLAKEAFNYIIDSFIKPRILDKKNFVLAELEKLLEKLEPWAKNKILGQEKDLFALNEKYKSLKEIIEREFDSYEKLKLFSNEVEFEANVPCVLFKFKEDDLKIIYSILFPDYFKTKSEFEKYVQFCKEQKNKRFFMGRNEKQ